MRTAVPNPYQLQRIPRVWCTRVNRLQQILFYRELGVSLEDIGRILSSPDFDSESALQSHLQALLAKQKQIDTLIANVEKTLMTMKGADTMTDKEKFDGFGEQLVAENEEKYGAEIRAKYGDETVDRSNAKVRTMSKARYEETEQLRKRLESKLSEAFASGDPTGPLAREACELHREWLTCYTDSYSKEYHMGLAEMYVNDARFTEYYDAIAPGCTAFLRDAIRSYCGE